MDKLYNKKDNDSAQKMTAKNNLLLAEIEQYHAVVKDFSYQSASIKKLSLTIYISFLSLYYGVDFVNMSNRIFMVIGLSISLFCYIYEIYIDNVRQKMRIRMQDKIISYEVNNNIKPNRKKEFLVYKLLFIKIYISTCGTCFYIRKIPDCITGNILYVNFVHSMYIIYLLEIVVTVLIGVVGV